MTASAGRVKVVAKVTIAAGPAAVFKYLNDSSRHFLWNPHLRTITPTMKLEEGSTYHSSSIVLGVKVRGKNKVIKLVPNKELCIENHTGLIRYRVQYRLRADAGQTRLTCTTSVDTDYKSLHFTDSIMRALAKRELQSDLQALKVAAENKL